jgi:hypothetical protein
MLCDVQLGPRNIHRLPEAFFVTCDVVVMCVVSIANDWFISNLSQSSATRTHSHRRAFAPSSRHGACALLARLSPRFCRSQPHTGAPTELQQLPRHSVASGDGPRVVEVPAGCVAWVVCLITTSKYFCAGFFVARLPERVSDMVKRIKNTLLFVRLLHSCSFS